MALPNLDILRLIRWGARGAVRLFSSALGNFVLVTAGCGTLLSALNSAFFGLAVPHINVPKLVLRNDDTGLLDLVLYSMNSDAAIEVANFAISLFNWFVPFFISFWIGIVVLSWRMVLKINAARDIKDNLP